MSDFSERLKQLCADYYYEEQDTPPMFASSMTRANALLDGSKKPTMDELSAISEAFDVSINYLLTGDEMFPSLHKLWKRDARKTLELIEDKRAEASEEEETAPLKSGIDKTDPRDYDEQVEEGTVARKAIDPYNPEKRMIRCISDGKAEFDFFEDGRYEDTFCEIDPGDFLWYLKPIVERELLHAGQEYEMTDGWTEEDAGFSMVRIAGMPKEEDWDYGMMPGFLFEELKPVKKADRAAHMEAYWDKIDEEDFDNSPHRPYKVEDITEEDLPF